MGLAGLLGGCSQGVVEEPVVAEAEAEAREAAIAFFAGMPEQTAVTRSTPLETFCTSFKVWSYKNTEKSGDDFTAYQTVINGYTVNWVANTAYTTASNHFDWEYVNGTTQTIKYWDWSAEAYRFLAVAPASASGTFALDGSGSNFLFTLYADASDDAAVAATPYFSELWFSDNSTDDYGAPVTLQFVKALSKVRIMFTFPDGARFGRGDLTEIGFAPSDGTKIQLQGNVGITYPLKGTGRQHTWTSTPDVSPTEELDAMERDWQETTDEYWYTVLPRTSQGNYTLSVRVMSDYRTATVPAEYMTWLPGYQYTYVFRVLTSGVVILDRMEMAVHDWEDSDYNHEFYNW